MYHLYYHGQHDYSKTSRFMSTPRDPDWPSHAQYLVNLYATAAKYEIRNYFDHGEDRMVPIIQDLLVTPFRYALEQLLPSSGYSTSVDQLARHVYLTHRELAAGLRKQLARFVVAETKRFTGGAEELEKFRAPVMDVPDFAFDLLLVAMDIDEESLRPSDPPSIDALDPRRMRNVR